MPLLSASFHVPQAARAAGGVILNGKRFIVCGGIPFMFAPLEHEEWYANVTGLALAGRLVVARTNAKQRGQADPEPVKAAFPDSSSPMDPGRA
jgi:hypothetical protein